MTNLHNKTALVTGGGRGIGRAIAMALAREGANIVVAARTTTELNAVADEVRAIGRRSIGITADVSVEGDVYQLVEKSVEYFGTVDILINNAGIGAFSKVAELATTDFDSVWATNMRGAFLCTKALLPHMIRRQEGDILNIASLAGRNAFVGGAAYCASKWALIGFSRCLMLEVREHNIRVITICPGSVETGFAGASERPHRSSGAIPRAEDIAQVVVSTLLMPRNVMVSEVDIRPTNPKK